MAFVGVVGGWLFACLFAYTPYEGYLRRLSCLGSLPASTANANAENGAGRLLIVFVFGGWLGMLSWGICYVCGYCWVAPKYVIILFMFMMLTWFCVRRSGGFGC